MDYIIYYIYTTIVFKVKTFKKKENFIYKKYLAAVYILLKRTRDITGPCLN